MEDKILAILAKKLQERIDQLSEALREGSAKDFAEYKDLCGVIRGLGLAQMEANDLLRKLKESNNDD